MVTVSFLSFLFVYCHLFISPIKIRLSQWQCCQVQHLPRLPSKFNVLAGGNLRGDEAWNHPLSLSISPQITDRWSRVSLFEHGVWRNVSSLYGTRSPQHGHALLITHVAQLTRSNLCCGRQETGWKTTVGEKQTAKNTALNPEWSPVGSSHSQLQVSSI